MSDIQIGAYQVISFQLSQQTLENKENIEKEDLNPLLDDRSCEKSIMSNRDSISLLKDIITSIGVDVQNDDFELKNEEEEEKGEGLRRISQAESELNLEEMQEDEVQIRRQNINQKVIRNLQQDSKPNKCSKNYFKDFSKNTIMQAIGNGSIFLNDSSQFFQLIDKRSRSETPEKMSATEVLYRAHKKLQAHAKRKESPHKLLERHQLRQKKAEELRSQIEQSKKNWYEKIRIRQQIAKERWKELLRERKAKLNNKLEQAEERRESEIQTLKKKAKQEIQKIDETNYIVKMTMSNMKLDLNMKMNETQERRTQIMEEHIKKLQHDRALKEEAAEKRRQELQKSTETKFLTNQQKREQADMRRSQMIEQKKRSAQEAQKRSLVLQRKNDLGDKISDVMSFVNNSECIWEFLGNERDWQEHGGFNSMLDDDLIFELIQKDDLEIQKMKLRRDAELLDKIIVIDKEGKIFQDKAYLPYAMKMINKKHEILESNSSDEDQYSLSSHDKKSESVLTPDRQSKQLYSPQRKYTDEEQKEIIQDYLSDGSDRASIPEEGSKDQLWAKDSNDEVLTDEAQNFMLSSIRLKMAMKRNILKKNLSEDLTWADFLKNETYNLYPKMKQVQIRSMCSTPERKQDIPFESENAEAFDSKCQSTNSLKSSQEKANAKGSILSNQNQAQPIQTSSSSNISEKSRISSVVYPSKKKKNPKNHANQPPQKEMKGSSSINSFKKQQNSNNSSTQSLVVANQFSESSITLGRKSTQNEINESAMKKHQSRLHSSSVQESSGIKLTTYNFNQQTSMLEDSEKFNESSNPQTHTGSQMNSLIANTKPSLPQSKNIQRKLTANASRLLFPIREQKLLIKRSGKEGQFGIFKVIVKMEDLTVPRQQSHSFLNQGVNSHSQLNDSSLDEKLPKMPEAKISQQRKSTQNTPSQAKRRESIDEQNTSSQNIESKEEKSQTDLNSSVSNPSQQPSKLLQIQQKFWEKYTSQQQQQQSEEVKRALVQNSIPSESSLSPPTKRDSKMQQQLEEINQTQKNEKVETIEQMNELGYKELLIKLLMQDNIQYLKTDENQKSITVEGQDSEKLIDYLESHELNIRYCRLCDLIIADHLTNEAHCQLKSHKKTREELQIKEVEDLQYTVISFFSQPGDIEKELTKEKEKALKRKVKRIKAQMISQAISHETASYNPGKDYNSPNKKRLQILCIDLEKQVIPIINNYEMLENTLKELIKILDMRKQTDLHLLRKLKYIPILIEICKRIQVCHKNEFKHLGKMLDFVIKIIETFCGLRENRNYMLLTNRMIALIELLNWCLNRPTQLFYGINFLPSLFHILTLHVKHRAPYECQQLKEMFIEYLICSSIPHKIKSKFQIINGPLDLTEMMGQVPLYLLKSAVFLESLTNVLQIDALVRPVYEKSAKIGEHVLFVIQNTEIFGIIPMITTILLSRNQPFKPSQNYQQPFNGNKILPQTILSLSIISVKILNNIMRMDYKAAQLMMSDFEIQEQLYHLFNFLLYYTVETADKQEDSKELLHETLLLMGYFALNNEKNQQLLCKGESTLLQKLCNLPFPYFCDKKLKEILFPTLVQASYKNERSLSIMDQEISIKLLVDFISLNLKEELPKIVEEVDDYHSISSLGGHQVNMDRRTRSPSQSSTSSQASMQIDIASGNSPFLSLYMRFPKKSWKDAIAFYSKVL